MRDERLSAALRGELRREQSTLQPPALNLDEIARRSRRHGLIRRSVPIGAAIVLLIAGWGVATTIVDGDNAGVGKAVTGSGEDVTPLPDLPPAPMDPGTEKDQAEVFAVRALTSHDLYDPLGEYYGLVESATRTDEGWRVGLSASQCTAQTCRPLSGTDKLGNGLVDSWMTVALSNSEWVVKKAEGNFSEEDAADLIGYTQPVTAEPAHWEYPSVSFSRNSPADEAGAPGHINFVAVQLWVGPIPSEARGTACWPEGVDAQGNVVFRGDPSYMPPPRQASERSSGFFHTGIPGEGVADIRITCLPYTGPDWKVVGSPTIEQTAQMVIVGVEVEWPGGPMSGRLGACAVTVFDESGEPIGSGRQGIQVWPAREADKTKFVAVLIDTDRPEDAVEATARCSLDL